MSTRSLIEINHDYLKSLVMDGQLNAFVMSLAYMNPKPGDDTIPQGIRYLGQRHHSEPEFLSEAKARHARAMLRRVYIAMTDPKSRANVGLLADLDRLIKELEA